MITAGYVVIVVGVGALLPVSDPLLSVAATAVVAVLFEPARRRAQRLADRLVYGHRATPYEALAQLSVQLPQAPEGLLAGIAATVAKADGATEVVVWVGDERVMTPAATWPERGDENTPNEGVALADLGNRPGTHQRPVVHRGRVLGAITVTKPVGEPSSRAERQLLEDLAAQTGLVIDHQAQAAEVKAAARRIVTAADAARRRIERDLHNGVQHRLVTLGLELGGLAEKAAAAGDADVAVRAESARRQLLEATAELREMARGLHPSVLTQDGLEPALANLADRSPIPVRLRVSVADRQPADVEATAYFLISEVITNTPLGTPAPPLLRWSPTSTTSVCGSRSPTTEWEVPTPRQAAGFRVSPTGSPHSGPISRPRARSVAAPDCEP
jgi:signal transduction histidine kinase